MSLRIRNDQLILHKIVFELKYRYGYTYLDKCGRTINMIQRTSPEWFNSAEAPNPQNASLINVNNGCALNFSTSKLDLSVERKPFKDLPMVREDVHHFAQQVELTGAVIMDQLGLQQFTRIGFRAWYLHASESLENAEDWLRSLSFYNISENLISAFGGKLEAVGVAVVLEGTDRKYRLAFNGVELQTKVDLGQAILSVRPRTLPKDQRDVVLKQEKIKKQLQDNPEFAAMIDIDAYQEDPEIVEPKDFVISSFENFERNLEGATGG